MQQINETSNDVSKVIKVIDEIAFQTNLLALNAAVEAACAGKYGKGFAVVAEETASASEELKQQAESLQNMMRKFKLKQGVQVGVTAKTTVPQTLNKPRMIPTTPVLAKR